MKRILVVANRTLCEQHLLDELRRRRAEGPATFHFVVPATHPSGWTWTETQAELDARARLDQLLDTLAVAGIGATGEIGDASPVTAVDDVLRREPFDELVVSTLPAGISRWLGQNVVRRLHTHTGLPVTHVLADRTPAEV